MSGHSYEDLEKQIVDLQDKLARRECSLRNVSKKALAIMEEICEEFAYNGPIIHDGRRDEHKS